MTSIRIIQGFGKDDGLTYPTVTPTGIKELTPSQRDKLLNSGEVQLKHTIKENMTPHQKLKHLVLLTAEITDMHGKPIKITEDNIDDLYDDAYYGDEYCLSDIIHGLRSGDFKTDLPCDYSRHYEAYSVAAKAPDGTYVGWTYWYGGGKHSDPEAIDWMDEAYNVDYLEEEKLVLVRTFTVKE